MKLRRSLLVRTGLTLALIMLLVGAALLWALRTESGARQIVQLALAQLSANVSVESVNGSFASGVTLSGVDAKSGDWSIRAGSIALDVDIAPLLQRTVQVNYLDITDVSVVHSASAAVDTTDSTPPELPDQLALPVNVVIDRLLVRTIRYGQNVDALELLVDRLQANGSWAGTELELAGFAIESVLGDVSATGRILTQGDYPIDLSIDSALRIPELAPVQSSTRFDGTLRKLHIEHSSAAPYSLEVQGSVREPLVLPDLSLQLEMQNSRLTDIAKTLPDVQLEGKVELTGIVAKLALVGEISGRLPEIGRIQTSFDATVSDEALAVESLSIEMVDVPDSPSAQANGIIALAEGVPTADMKFTWKRLRWPLQNAALVSSAAGLATFTGPATDFALTVNGAVATRYEPDGRVEFVAKGNRQNVRIDPFVLEILDGTLRGKGRVEVSDGISVVASVQGSGVNPGGLSRDWPGVLKFDVSGKAEFGDERFTAHLETITGGGQLRGFPVTFDGGAVATSKGLDIERLNVQSGPTRISASGEVADQISLLWNIDSADLNSLWPGMKGQLAAGGQASGTASQPTLTFTVKGSSLGYKEFALAAIEADVDVSESVARLSTINLSASDLKAGPYESKEVVVSAEGTLDSHSVTINIEDDLGKSLVSIDGGLNGDQAYEFFLNQVSLLTPDIGEWLLEKPSAGVVSGNAFSLSDTCLQHEQSSLCLSGQADRDEFSADVDLRELPLSIISHLVPGIVRARGTVNGGGNISVSAKGTSAGSVRFDISPLDLESRLRDDTKGTVLTFDPSSLTASIDETGALGLAASFPLRSGGGLAFDGAVLAGTEALLDRSIKGELSLEVPSIGFVTDYLADVSKAAGRVEGEVNLTGSLRRPEVLGSFELVNGELTLPGPGIETTDLSLTLSGNRDNSFTLTGGAASGGGTVEMDGTLKLSDEGNLGQFNLKGSDFQVVNTSESQVWASPDVQVVYADEALELDGLVLIPKANLRIDALPKGTSRVSRDQVIVGQVDNEDAALIPLTAELELRLGENVYLSAFGLDAFLDGAITILEAPDKPTTATGEVNLREGEYQAYGQQLTITTGRLLYAGGALVEPGIDLRAVRSPAAGIEVGVSARGTISQPTFSVFSSPAMSDSDQLAYLIFGRPINAEATSESALITRAALTLGMQGGESLTQKLADDLGVDQLGVESQGSGDLSQASLVIGKYLSPKLFVSYGIGLLEPVSTLKLEYALSSRWQLVTESSSTRTSADAQYTFER